MISPLRLEQGGRWRRAGILLCFLSALLPSLPLIFTAVFRSDGFDLGEAYGPAMGKSLVIALAVALLVFSAFAIPLVLLTAFAATRTLSASQVDAARLAGGGMGLFRNACRYAASPACLAAGLAGVLTLCDPGPGQIFGLRTAASEILVSFSAFYDFGLAGRQCLVLAATVLVATAPLVLATAPRLSSRLLAGQVGAARPIERGGMVSLAAGGLGLLLLIGLAPPLLGLLRPLGQCLHFGRALSVLQRTGWNTILYAAGSGLTATFLGFLLAFLAGRGSRLRLGCLGLGLALFALPPAQIALGAVQLGAFAPAWADPLLRGQLAVCLALGLRLFPVAMVLGLRAWGTLPPSWTGAATLYGVPLSRYLFRVIGPFFLPAAVISVLLAALLATADVTTVLLLHPPGEESLPLALFTIMANAPESLTASLCLVYILASMILLSLLWFIARRPKP